MIESDPRGFLALLAAMIGAVYLTRAGGYWLIGRVTIGHRLQRVLNTLPGAVIAATIAPVLVQGGLSAASAMLVAAAVMYFWRRDFAAVAAGVAAAAGAFALGL
jgi:uncharacterized membrane protein